jgi:hypothetical protein
VVGLTTPSETVELCLPVCRIHSTAAMRKMGTGRNTIEKEPGWSPFTKYVRE